MTMQLNKITVFGATGGVGRLVVAQAVAAGYGVTAAVRNPAGLPAGVHVVTVDLAAADPAAVDRAVDGADAVLCCIGARSKAETGIAETGVSAIVRAMSASGSRRFVAISAGPVSTVASPARPDPPPDPGNRFLMRTVAVPIAQRVFRRQYADLARMEDVIRASGLAWTILGSPTSRRAIASARRSGIACLAACRWPEPTSRY